MTPAEDGERPPRPGRRMLVRAGLAATAVLLLTVTATATAGLLKLGEVADALRQAGPPVVPARELSRAAVGDAQTILLVGSDRRREDRGDKEAARSDTLMLVRLDPDEPATSLLSIPRDLRVDIPGVGTRKINEAYSEGGATLALRTVKRLTGLDVNHVAEVNFRGFRGFVDAIGCLYADVDRRYHHSNPACRRASTTRRST